MRPLYTFKHTLSALLFLLVAAPTAWAKTNTNRNMRGLHAAPPINHTIFAPGVSFVIPYGAFINWLGDDTEKTSYTYRLSAMGKYTLTEGGTGLEVKLTYKPTTFEHTKHGLILEEQHFTILPALAFTRTSDGSIYRQFTFSIGYEFDYTFSSKLKKANGELDSTWDPPYSWAGNIVAIDRYEFPYGFYAELIATIPITHLYNLVQLGKKERVKLHEHLLATARINTSNWFELGIGLNIIGLTSSSQPQR
jgi:hypothetical protein